MSIIITFLLAYFQGLIQEVGGEIEKPVTVYPQPR